MDPWATLRSILQTDPRGLGCEENLEIIHAYAHKILNGGEPEDSLSEVTAHLDQCPPCAEDLRGLLQAVHERWDEAP